MGERYGVISEPVFDEIYILLFVSRTVLVMIPTTRDRAWIPIQLLRLLVVVVHRPIIERPSLSWRMAHINLAGPTP